MGLRGPKKLSSAELKRRGSRLNLVKAREQEEQATHARQTFRPKAEVSLPLPEGLTHPVAIAWWHATMELYTVDKHVGQLVVLAAFNLQLIEECKAAIATQGKTYTDAHGRQHENPQMKIQLDREKHLKDLYKTLNFLT